MPIYVLQLKATLENIGLIHPTLDSIKISVQHPQDDSQTRSDVILSCANDVEMHVQHGDGFENVAFNMSWEQKTKPASCVVCDAATVKKALPKKCKNAGDYTVRDYTEDDSGSFVPVLAVDFSGMEPTSFTPADCEEFEVTTIGGKKFTSDLVAFDDDWCEYDDENDESVSVQEIEFQWVLLKK
ncbi:hypothetical protein ScalyP_jg4048 [Parmales sp. scaly parma]|nr:hypothetical protein ScalyP_jg4048 [Parmales sp. scaly parma]